ncbi:hypothetical protein [Cyclobacterium qasimii]|uniref:Uncharacterized protein n=2 Tax=Cyclobacterium qasimii TaxID=1350429 RepID=S7VCQ6_9BACT|nr:hypothetical protein [Cyclobacterium qasimii]EPR67347.1 hypothetical protein ADICYQ_3620 [Cyclobacterium qasimii M12-11B]GEO20459.1 hypothetical protein CQA01_09930 [Cyclobacterium qasimii]
MKSKLLFLPDVLLLLFICIACERHELRHTQFRTNGETVISSKKTEKNIFMRDKNNNEMAWETIKDNLTEHFAGLKAKVLED